MYYNFRNRITQTSGFDESSKINNEIFNPNELYYVILENVAPSFVHFAKNKNVKLILYDLISVCHCSNQLILDELIIKTNILHNIIPEIKCNIYQISVDEIVILDNIFISNIIANHLIFSCSDILFYDHHPVSTFNFYYKKIDFNIYFKNSNSFYALSKFLNMITKYERELIININFIMDLQNNNDNDNNNNDHINLSKYNSMYQIFASKINILNEKNPNVQMIVNKQTE